MATDQTKEELTKIEKFFKVNSAEQLSPGYFEQFLGANEAEKKEIVNLQLQLLAMATISLAMFVYLLSFITTATWFFYYFDDIMSYLQENYITRVFLMLGLLASIIYLATYLWTLRMCVKLIDEKIFSELKSNLGSVESYMYLFMAFSFLLGLLTLLVKLVWNLSRKLFKVTGQEIWDQVKFKYGFFLCGFCILVKMSYILFAVYSYWRINSGYETEMYEMFVRSNNEIDSWKIDSVQNYFKCCGVKGLEDWKYPERTGLFNYRPNNTVKGNLPASCCFDQNPKHACSDEKANDVRGCNENIKSRMLYYLTVKSAIFYLLLNCISLLLIVFIDKTLRLMKGLNGLTRISDLYKSYDTPTKRKNPTLPKSLENKLNYYGRVINNLLNVINTVGTLSEKDKEELELATRNVKSWEIFLSIAVIERKMRISLMKYPSKNNPMWKELTLEDKNFLVKKIKSQYEDRTNKINKLINNCPVADFKVLLREIKEFYDNAKFEVPVDYDACKKLGGNKNNNLQNWKTCDCGHEREAIRFQALLYADYGSRSHEATVLREVPII